MSYYRLFIRSLFLLSLFCSHGVGASTISYWKFQHVSGYTSPEHYSSSIKACQSYNPHPDATYFLSGSACYRGIWGVSDLVGHVFSETQECPYGNAGAQCNTSCDLPDTMVNGQCVEPPPDCSTAPDIYSAQECTYSESLKLFICPDTVNSNGCAYVSSPNGESNCDISTSICVGRYSPTGNESAPNAPECTGTTCAPLPSAPGQAPENCVAGGGSTYCFEDQESGCGTFNGVDGCFQNDPGCG